jgi:hypothetical protein
MDPLIQQSINSLLDLSRYRLGLICHHLVNQLENISKVHITLILQHQHQYYAYCSSYHLKYDQKEHPSLFLSANNKQQ